MFSICNFVHKNAIINSLYTSIKWRHLNPYALSDLMVSQHQVFTLWSAGVWHHVAVVQSSWNVMAHGDPREGKYKGNWRMEWVASTLHTTSEHCVSSIATADAHTSAATSWLNWRPRLFKWTCPFHRKMKSGFCACAITFQMQSTYIVQEPAACITSVWNIVTNTPHCMQSHSKCRFITHELTPPHTHTHTHARTCTHTLSWQYIMR
jgi:hypothetical protein